MKKTLGLLTFTLTLTLTLTLSLSALPAQAVTSVAPGSAPNVLMTDMHMGVIERFTSTSIQVGGKTFFLSPTIPVYDRHGNRLAALTIDIGTKVKFTLADDSTRQRIKALWINQ